LKLAEFTYSRRIIRQPPNSPTMSRVPSVEPESATSISSAMDRMDSMQERMFLRSFLQGISTVSFWRKPSARDVDDRNFDFLHCLGDGTIICPSFRLSRLATVASRSKTSRIIPDSQDASCSAPSTACGYYIPYGRLNDLLGRSARNNRIIQSNSQNLTRSVGECLTMPTTPGNLGSIGDTRQALVNRPNDFRQFSCGAAVPNYRAATGPAPAS
jgi:hypothetical protein